MKILMHIDSFGSGGAQRQIVALATSLAARGHHVEFHTYYKLNHFLPTVEAANIPVRVTEKTRRFSIAPIRGLISHARKMQADAIIAFLRTPSIHAEIAGLFLKDCKIIVAERSAIPKKPLPMKYRLLQQLHRLAGAVTVNSKEAGEQMSEAFPWMKKKLHHITNGYKIWPSSPRNGVVEGPLKLLTLASVRPGKDAVSLAKALRICIQEKRIPVQIDWAGEPMIFDGVSLEKDRTDAYLREHNLVQHWNWLGLVSDTNALFPGCDALIHTSKAEGFANAIAESLLNSTPVIIGRIGDQPAVVETSQAGLLFDIQDPQSIADAIHEYYEMSAQQRARMSVNARNYAENALSIETTVSRYETLARELSEVS